MALPVPTEDARPETATSRVTVLMTPTEKETLFALAKHQGFRSVGEYLRRKAFDREETPELDAVLDTARTSIRTAAEALDRAVTRIESRLDRTAEHDAEVRAAAMGEFRAWTPTELRQVGVLFGGRS